jgi:hypothetical protein
VTPAKIVKPTAIPLRSDIPRSMRILPPRAR